MTHGRIILGLSRKTKYGSYSNQNEDKRHGMTPDVAEHDNQSDFDWNELTKLQEEVFGSSGPRSPAVETLLKMKPMVECGADLMTLRVKGGSLLYLLVDRGDASPLPLSKLPPHCGYSLSTTWRDTVFTVPYDGCYGVKEGDSYVLPLRWGGTPLRMTCPAGPHVAASPAVSCHPSGMVVTIPASADASKLTIKYKGTWNPLLWVSVQCGYSVVTYSGGIVVTAPFATCGETKDGMYTMEFMEGKVKVSCPSQPLTGPHSVPSPEPLQTNISHPSFIMSPNPNEPRSTPPPVTVTWAQVPVTFALRKPVSWHNLVPQLPTHAPVHFKPVPQLPTHAPVHFKPVPHLPTHAPVHLKPVPHNVPGALVHPVPLSHKRTTPAPHPHFPPPLWNPNAKYSLLPVSPPSFPLPAPVAPVTPTPVIPKLAPPFPRLPTRAPYTPIPWYFNLLKTPVPIHPHFYPRPPKPTPEIPTFPRSPPAAIPHPLTDPLYTPIPKPAFPQPVRRPHPAHTSPTGPHNHDLFYPALPKPPILSPMVPELVRPVAPAVPCLFPACPWPPVSHPVFYHNHMHFNLGSRFTDCAQTHHDKPYTFPKFMLPSHRHHNLQDSSMSQRWHHYENPHVPLSQPFSHFWDLVAPFSEPSNHMRKEQKGSLPQSYNPNLYWNPAHPKLLGPMKHSQNSETG